MRRREATEAVLGTFERLFIHPDSKTISLLVVAPIDQHANAIVGIGPSADSMRAVGADPDPVCTIAVLSAQAPVHPETDAIAVARACLAYLETHHGRGSLRAIAPELEERFGQLANAAREDRLVASTRKGLAQ